MAMAPMYTRRNNGATGYHPPGTGDPSTGSTSTTGDTRTIYNIAGVYRRLGFYIVSNAATGTGLFTFRINGADGNQTITIPVSAGFVPGFYQDPINVDAPTGLGTDLLQIGQLNGTGGGTAVRVQGCVFQAAQDTAAIMGSFNVQGTGVSTASRTTRLNANGTFTTEDPSQALKMQIAGVFRSISLNMVTNSRVTSGVTFGSRLNQTTNGNLTLTTIVGNNNPISMTATDTVAVNDLYGGITNVTAGGSGTAAGVFLHHFVSVANQMQYSTASTTLAGTSYGAGVTRYEGITGRIGSDTTEDQCYTHVGVVATARFGGVYAISNAATATSTATFMVNTVASGMTVTIPASGGGFVAGLIADSGVPIPLLPDDQVDWKLVVGSGGSLVIAYFTNVLDMIADPTASNRLALLGVG